MGPRSVRRRPVGWVENQKGGVSVSERVAGPGDIDGIVSTLVGAFFDDPLWSFAFPDPERRRSQHTSAFTALVASAMPHGWVWTTEGYGAVSVWIPPGEPEMTPEEAVAFSALIETIAPGRVGVVRDMFTAFDEAHPHEEPHYYLSLLGTNPQRRGEGLGMDLLAANLEKIDSLQAAAYLESSNPVNLARYESVGFRGLGKTVVTPDGNGFTGMWRAPKI